MLSWHDVYVHDKVKNFKIHLTIIHFYDQFVCYWKWNTPTRDLTTSSAAKVVQEKNLDVWSLLRGSVLWLTWLARNVVCFQAETWQLAKLEVTVWEALFDHAKVAWTHYLMCMKLHPASTVKFIQRFDDNWCSSKLVYTRIDLTVHWNYQRPRIGSFQ
jgi:hypothetical protein